MLLLLLPLYCPPYNFITQAISIVMQCQGMTRDGGIRQWRPTTVAAYKGSGGYYYQHQWQSGSSSAIGQQQQKQQQQQQRKIEPKEASAPQIPCQSISRFGTIINNNNNNNNGRSNDDDHDKFTWLPPLPPPLVSDKEHEHGGNVPFGRLPRGASSPFPCATPLTTSTTTTAETTQGEGDAVLRAIRATSDQLIAQLEALATAYRNFDAANGGAGLLVQRLIKVQGKTAARAILVFGETMRQAVEDHLCDDGGDDSGHVSGKMTAREQRFLDLYDQVALAKDQVDRYKRELRQATRTLDEAKAAALQQDRAVARATTAVANASVAHASAVEAHDRALRSIDRVYHKLPGDLHARVQQRQSIERSASSFDVHYGLCMSLLPERYLAGRQLRYSLQLSHQEQYGVWTYGIAELSVYTRDGKVQKRWSNLHVTEE
ncbi:hypothetical protein IWZ03DRAFT_410033 [Phyllosticta citriasiana]|uniref:Uncharacterized protein n=1 Tax=Phyllosticta citriasiana TaxID=595635 RepID=A0ABR1KCS5_9PEZI